jgi:hypothetical protein
MNSNAAPENKRNTVGDRNPNLPSHWLSSERQRAEQLTLYERKPNRLVDGTSVAHVGSHCADTHKRKPCLEMGHFAQ